MGIHRINKFFVTEFGSPGDLRFRIETDIRMPAGRSGRDFVRKVHAAAAGSRDETLRDLLLARLARPVRKREKVSAADLVRVRRLVIGALSDAAKPLPDEGLRKKRR